MGNTQTSSLASSKDDTSRTYGSVSASASLTATPRSKSRTTEQIKPEASPSVSSPRALPFFRRQSGDSSPPPFGSPLDPPWNYNSDALDSSAPQTPTTSEFKSSCYSARFQTGIPTVFRWTNGGQQVAVTGTFTDWQTAIPLTRSHDEFSTIIGLNPGHHEFRFIVDGEPICSPDQITVQAEDGSAHNIVFVNENQEQVECDLMRSSPPSPPGEYDQDIPDLCAPVSPKQPPALPPHLLQVILNAEQVSESDPTILPVPNHVMLSHLYALSIKDGVMVFGATHRYRKKYVTTVLYKPVSND